VECGYKNNLLYNGAALIASASKECLAVVAGGFMGQAEALGGLGSTPKRSIRETKCRLNK